MYLSRLKGAGGPRLIHQVSRGVLSRSLWSGAPHELRQIFRLAVYQRSPGRHRQSVEVTNSTKVSLMKDKIDRVDLVLEGGGVKGLGLLGAVLTLADAGIRFERIAGTSAGAIVAALVASYQCAGRDLHDLEKVMRTVDYERFADRAGVARLVGGVGDPIETILHGGGHSGDYLTEWLGPILEEEAGVRTFGDLRREDTECVVPEQQRYSLLIHVTDLTRRALVRLPWDYEEYEINADDQLVVDAVRASMSIPFYFRPVQVHTRRGTATWVDGGLLSSYPITVFDRTDGEKPRWPTWGVKLSGRPDPKVPDKPARTGVGLVFGCVHTVLADWDRYQLDRQGVSRRTIYVDTNGVSTTDFDISEATQEMLFANGVSGARKFLDEQPATDAEYQLGT